MKVGTGAAAGITHQGDGFAALGCFALLFYGLFQMGVTGCYAMSMINDNYQAKGSFLTDEGDNAVRGGDNRGSVAVGDIKAFVEFALACER